MRDGTWDYEGYDPAQERLRESLCTLGNGYFATRGAAPECAADAVHYPGTYVAGCYSRLTSQVSGREVENEDMVNLPNWLPLRLRTATGTWLTPDTHRLLDHRLRLDLCAGTLERTARYEDEEGRRIAVRQLRLVHMADPHLALLRTEVTAEGWSGSVEIESALDGTVANSGVERYRSLASRHLKQVRTGTDAPDTIWLHCRTAGSETGIGLAARTVTDAPAVTTEAHTPGRAAQVLRITLTEGRTVTVDKTVALHTSHDPAIKDPMDAAVDRVGRAADFETLLDTHRTAWQQLWRNTELDVPNSAGPILRLHLFHLLQTLSPHTAELDVGVPARGLHGEAYRGHVFWDELFVLPYLNLHFPEVSRALLTYRHRRLERARRSAQDAGHTGAMYPWQSGSDGREETQQLHLNPRSGRWLPDHSRLQHHVGSAIAYNVWQYCEASGDTEFLHTKGLEMLVQIARFWGGFAEYDGTLGRYRIRGSSDPTSTTTPTRARTDPGSTTTRTRTSRPPGCSPARSTCCTSCPNSSGGTSSSGSAWTPRSSTSGTTCRAGCTCPSTPASSASSRATAISRNSTGRATANGTATSGGSTGSWRPRATASTATGPRSRRTC